MSPHTGEHSLSPWTLQQNLLLSELANSALVNLLPWAQQTIFLDREKITLDKHVSTFDFKWFVWARTEEKIMDLAYFHDIVMMTLSSYCLLGHFLHSMSLINSSLSDYQFTSYFLNSFPLTVFMKRKLYQPFPDMIFIPISLPSEQPTWCFEFRWIIRKGRMDGIWHLEMIMKTYCTA